MKRGPPLQSSLITKSEINNSAVVTIANELWGYSHYRAVGTGPADSLLSGGEMFVCCVTGHRKVAGELTTVMLHDVRL